VWSPGLDSRWQADVLVNSQKPSEFQGREWQYALIVVDVFSRYLWARLRTSPMEAYAGLREILDEAGKAPDVLSTDQDPGFLSPKFKELLESKGIQQSLRAGRN
jgi:transposase InsO family protein